MVPPLWTRCALQITLNMRQTSSRSMFPTCSALFPCARKVDDFVISFRVSTMKELSSALAVKAGPGNGLVRRLLGAREQTSAIGRLSRAPRGPRSRRRKRRCSRGPTGHLRSTLPCLSSELSAKPSDFFTNVAPQSLPTEDWVDQVCSMIPRSMSRGGCHSEWHPKQNLVHVFV